MSVSVAYGKEMCFTCPYEPGSVGLLRPSNRGLHTRISSSFVSGAMIPRVTSTRKKDGSYRPQFHTRPRNSKTEHSDLWKYPKVKIKLVGFEQEVNSFTS